MKNISEEDFIDIEEYILELIDEYIDCNFVLYSKNNFKIDLIENITDILYEEWLDYNIITNDDYDDLYDVVENISDLYYDIFNIPERSQFGIFSDCYKTNNDIEDIKQNIHFLKNVYQPKQKTEEWYKFRHELLTASNIWKVFGSESQVNSIIYDKCKPFEPNATNHLKHCNTLKWGNKYESASIKIYEKLYNTKVEDFGCIQHQTYKYIAASPDGINVKEDSSRYGRMVEVKNIVNRDITGYPKEEYWIQMQIQMETCNLEECDFIETRFKEFEKEEEFYNYNEEDKEKGIILSFISLTPKCSDIRYEYLPIDHSLEKVDIDLWIQNKKTELKDTHLLYLTHYWYLDEFSCILVKRNRKWFQSAVAKIKDTWEIITKEKQTGYEHRGVKKNKVKLYDSTNNDIHIFENIPVITNVCLIKLDENGNI